MKLPEGITMTPTPSDDPTVATFQLSVTPEAIMRLLNERYTYSHSLGEASASATAPTAEEAIAMLKGRRPSPTMDRMDALFAELADLHYFERMWSDESTYRSCGIVLDQVRDEISRGFLLAGASDVLVTGARPMIEKLVEEIGRDDAARMHFARETDHEFRRSGWLGEWRGAIVHWTPLAQRNNELLIISILDGPTRVFDCRCLIDASTAP